ncbi:MAG: hypothetical protein OXM61_23435 [Candidatus Poribacteria bacterium]|nr:hypothetical protein [Candidatus Poribacteria bacterium]
MNLNEIFRKITSDTEHAKELFNKASYYFWNGDIDSLEKLLESNPDSPIILQYIELYNSKVLLDK